MEQVRTDEVQAEARVGRPAALLDGARRRVGFVSLGCPKNLVDSEVMMGILARAGAEMVNRPESADILVVNTCSFIDKAKQESIDAILQLAQHKNSGQARRLIVAGCLVERYRSEILSSIPEVDAVVGTGELDRILAAAGLRPAVESDASEAAASLFPILSAPAAAPQPRPEATARELQGRFDRQAWQGASAELPQYLYDHTTPRMLATGSASAYIKIAEGCDHPCSFCVIPNLRGKFRSRRFESVVSEAEGLVSGGVREITLIGQDTTCYGEDLGLRDGLAQLLDRLAAIPGLKWLRFLYAYPNRITPRLLEVMGRHDNICKYLDMPLQHAAAPVLKRMRRGGGPEIFLETIGRIRTALPGVALRTSFIAGFPGESQADFDVLLEFVREARFDWLGVFEYSDEEGSGAHELEGKLPRKTIAARRRALMREQSSISRALRSRMVGRTVDLLALGPSEETPLLWEGRTEQHAPEIDGRVYVNDFGAHASISRGRFYRCEITEAHDYDLVGRIAGESA